MALLTKYRFEVIDGATVKDVTPMNDRLQMEWERKDNARYFRKALKTPLRFIKTDFKYFEDEYAENECKSFVVKIYRKCLSQTFTLWHEGKIYLNDGKYDHARGIVEFEVEPTDLYTCFLKNIKKKVNLLEFGTSKKTLNIAGTIVETECIGSLGLPGQHLDCIPGGATAGLWTVINHTDNENYPDPPSRKTTWAREEWGTSTPPDDSWTLVGGTWVRKVVIASSVTNNNLPPFYTYEAFLFDFSTQGGIDNGRLFKDILDDVINAAGCGFDLIVSNFFDVNPDSTNPTNDAYTRAATRLKYMMIYQRTDIMKWNASDNATRADITIEDFLKVLQDLFQVYWVIVETEDGLTFRLEHVSYFAAVNQNDFTVGSYADFTRAYKRYTVAGKDKVPPYEVFSNPGSRQNSVFADTRITYAANCVTSDQQRENPVPIVSTDLKGTIYNDLLNPEGLFFMATYKIGSTHYVYQDYSQLNGSLSWWELVRYYWMHDRFNGAGTITTFTNTATVDFLTKKRIKEQPEIKIPVPCDVQEDFNPDALQKLPLGWSEVRAATYDSKTETLSLKTTI